MKKNGFRFLVSLLTSALIVSSFAGIALAKEFTYNVKFVRDHTSARQIATKVNDLRTKNAWYWAPNDQDKVYPQLGALTYDYALEEIAMQRAAELVFRCENYRPDGSEFFTLMVGDVMSFGELINDDCSSADEVFTRWARENDNYEYQNTRRRMMDADFNAIGVGHVKCGNRNYWTIEFGKKASNTAAPSQINNTVNYPWTYDDELIYLNPIFTEARFKIPMNQKKGVNDLVKDMSVMSKDYKTTVPVPISECSFSFVSQDTSILKVENNLLVPVKQGSTKIQVYVTWNGVTQGPMNKSVSVTGASSSNPTPTPGQGRTSPTPTARPTVDPWARPTTRPTTQPTNQPTAQPTFDPWAPRPTSSQTIPTTKPTTAPGININPTDEPETPTSKPSKPTTAPSNDPKSNILAFVNRIYIYVLDREPEAEGAQFWSDELYNFSRNGAEVAQGFIFSQEFYDRNTSDTEYVTILYKTFFDREPDDAGMRYWLLQLSRGTMSWQDVANGFIFSQEWADTCASYGIRSGGDIKPNCVIEPTDLTYSFVERMYTTAMKRGYDAEGRAYWAAQLANFEITGEQVGASFFLSEEMFGYQLNDKEYILRLYKTFMDRDPDNDGLNYWLGFAKDHTKAELVYGFTRSPEFTDKCVEARILPY